MFSKITGFVKKNIVGFIIGFIVAFVLCSFVAPRTATAGELKVFETGVVVNSDFTDVKNTSLDTGTVYNKGEFDGIISDNLILDWNANINYTDWKRDKDTSGNVGLHYRFYTVKGDSLEFLGGINQPIYVDDNAFEFSKTRQFILRVRKPL